MFPIGEGQLKDCRDLSRRAEQPHTVFSSFCLLQLYLTQKL
jgi:hypothetical protein